MCRSTGAGSPLVSTASSSRSTSWRARGLQRLDVEDRGDVGESADGRLPGVDGDDGRVATPTLLDRPGERSTGHVGTVDADHDPLRPLLEWCVDDGDGARRVVQHLATHGTEQEPVEAAEAAGADEDELGARPGLDEGAGREVADRPLFDGGVRAERSLDERGERGLGVVLVVLGVERVARRGVVLVEVAPRQHRRHGLPAPRSLGHCPPQRLDRVR